MMIEVQTQRIIKGDTKVAELYLPSILDTIDLDTLRFSEKTSKYRGLVNPVLDKYKRIRPKRMNKLAKKGKSKKDRPPTFAPKSSAYGLLWAEKVKKNKEALPSLQEVLVGLARWLVSDDMLGYTPDTQQRTLIKQLYGDCFEKIKKCLTLQNLDYPLVCTNSQEDDNLWNPNGQAACLLLQLQSMDLGG